MKLTLIGEVPVLRNRAILKVLMVMKLITLIMIVASVHIYASGYSQKVSLSEKDEKLTRIFTSIQQQTGYTFFYKRSLVKDATASVKVVNASLDKALQEVLKDTRLRFAIVDKTIVIQRDDEARTAIPVSVIEAAVPITVTGTVQSTKGELLIGATVRIKGQNAGVSTDVNGRFSISAEASDILVVSYTGFQSQEVAVNNRTMLTIILLTSSLWLLPKGRTFQLLLMPQPMYLR